MYIIAQRSGNVNYIYQLDKATKLCYNAYMKSINQILRPYTRGDALTERILNWVHDYNVKVDNKQGLTYQDPKKSPEHYVNILVKMLAEEGIDIIKYHINPAHAGRTNTDVTVDLIMSNEDALLYKLKY